MDFSLSENFTRFAREEIPKWEGTYTTWFENFTSPAHLIIYDHMLDNMEHDLAGMAKFIQFKYTSLTMCCVTRNEMGSFRRRQSQISRRSMHMHMYTTDLLDLFQQTIDRVLSILYKRFPEMADFRFKPITEME